MKPVILSRVVSTNGVYRMLAKAVEWWNSFVSLVLGLVMEDITTIWNGALWKLITDIYTALLPVGYALCIMTFLIGLFKAAADIVETKRAEHIIKCIIRYILTYSVLTNGLTLIKGVVQVVQGCMIYVFNVVGLDSLTFKIPDSVRHCIVMSLTAEQILYFVLVLLLFLLILLYGFVLLLTVVGRFSRLGIAAALLPIGFAWFGGDTTKEMGRAHVKTYLATCLEGLVLVVALCMSAVFVENFGIKFDANSVSGEYKKVYAVKYDSKLQELYVTVVNDYTEGGYTSAFYDYPINKYLYYVTETTAEEGNKIDFGGMKYYQDKVGDTYTLNFGERDSNFFYDAYEEFRDYTVASSQSHAMDEMFTTDDDSIGYVIQWMLVLAFNIVLFVNMVKGMDSFSSNLIKGG